MMAKSLLLRFRRPLVYLCNVSIIAFSLVLAFLLRFDFILPASESPLLYRALVLASIIKPAAFYLGGLDRGWWRFVGLRDLRRVFLSNAAASSLFTLAAMALMSPQFPRSVYFVDFILCFLGTAGARFAGRLYHEAVASELNMGSGRGLLIYGAGLAGMTLAREVMANRALSYHIIGFLDDDPNKRGAIFLNIPVLGTGRDVPHIVDRHKRTRCPVEEVLIAMPSATRLQMQEALANCRVTGVTCKTIPTISELLSGKILTSQIRNVEITDLLGREPARLEEERIRSTISGRSVLITGAAGSIGSELCRQVARFEPGILIAFDQAESDLFKIDLELRKKYPLLDLAAELGDIRDARRVEEVIRRYSVDSIFHAAAYKHVPMMEAHILEAVKNNVFGTNNLVQAARRNHVANFLLISSDKAVRPTNIMGLTKRIAELIVLAGTADEGTARTKFVSVRFGNVLGSNGSVVPTFQAQIAAGGPVTVTHPEVCRYFMSIPEAVQLVLQASAMGKGSEIFVLEMGEPVRIIDLAQNLIRLSGRVPHEEIEIRYTGLRPGEKLFEELITEGEGIQPTYHEKIKILSTANLGSEFMNAWIEELDRLVQVRDERAVLGELIKLVPEYKSAGLPTAPVPTRLDEYNVKQIPALPRSGVSAIMKICLLVALFSANSRAMTWWVSPSGNDSSSGMNPSHAFATLSKAASVLRAGDVVLVSGTIRDQVVFWTTGTANSPITIRSIPKGPPALILPPLANGNPALATLTFARVQYYTVSDLRISGWKGNPQAPAEDHFGSNVISVSNGAANITVLNSELFNGLHCGLKEVSGTVNANVVARNNNIHDNGTTTLDHGIYGCDHCTFDGNTIHDNAAYGIHAYSAPPNVTITNNTFYNNGVTTRNGGAILIAGPNATVTGNLGYSNWRGIFYFRSSCTNPVVMHNQMMFNIYRDVDWDDGGGQLGSPSGVTDDYNLYGSGTPAGGVASSVPLGAHDCVVPDSKLASGGCGRPRARLRRFRPRLD
jgi:parallel beta-helix repeat protein